VSDRCDTDPGDEEIAGRDLSVVSQIPVTLGVWLLSDNRSLSFEE